MNGIHKQSWRHPEIFHQQDWWYGGSKLPWKTETPHMYRLERRDRYRIIYALQYLEKLKKKNDKT